MDCLQNHITTVRDYIDEPATEASEWSDASIVGYLTGEARKVALLIRKRKQDFMGNDIIIPLVSSTYTYDIPMGHIRKVEILKSGVTAEGNGVYAVAADALKAEIDQTEFHTLMDEGDEGWALWGSEMRISYNYPDITTGNYLRVAMIRPLPPLFAGTMLSATATNIVVAAGAPTYGEAAKESNSYKGFGIKIYDGTGKGQERRILKDSFDGTNHTFTVATWTTTPAGTVYYSITPPFPDEFDDVLPMGAAMTAKWRVDDSNPELKEEYNTTLAAALDSYFPRNLNGSRRVRKRADVNGFTRTVIIRRP
jgi:hypothetical protein